MNCLSHNFLILVTFCSLLAMSCNPSSGFDPEGAKLEILSLHNAQRDFHFNKDSVAFANSLSDSFISVNRGYINHPTKESNITRYHNYFSSVEFHEWDDVSEPIIRFSDDGSLAYTIVDKIVRLSYKDDEGKTIQDTTHYAWTAIYKRYKDGWTIDCVTSTQRS